METLFNTWTLKVRDFGKISKADIRVTPFMMLVGENNSGKSYILELLWGVFKNLDVILKDYLDEDEQFQKLQKSLENKLRVYLKEPKGIERIINIDTEIQMELMRVLNRILSKAKEWLVKETFNHSIKIGKLEIHRDRFFNIQCSISPDTVISTELVKREGEEEQQEVEVSREVFIFQLYLLNIDGESENIYSHLAAGQFVEDIPRVALSRIISLLVGHDYSVIRKSFAMPRLTGVRRTRKLIHDPVYFPASRTGFMLIYKTIFWNENIFLKGLLKNEEDEEFYGAFEDHFIRLTAPVEDYLNKLTTIHVDEAQKEYYKKELGFLTKQIFRGSVTRDQASNIQFVPERGDGIPLHITSSLVAELAPLSIFLESQYDPQLLIIEESESHLHVGKQLELVRFFFRLINKGKSVWLTTHSDSFAQQVNNLLTLSRRPDKEALCRELGYESADTLPDVAYSSCYQFQEVNGKTIVEEIELGEFGYAIPTFNNVLEKLMIETSKIQAQGEADE